VPVVNVVAVDPDGLVVVVPVMVGLPTAKDRGGAGWFGIGVTVVVGMIKIPFVGGDKFKELM